MKHKIALGGGCHWCTEAVFQSLIGVTKVEQGFVASENENASFSEAVIVHFNQEEISLKTLIEIHLYTHKSTSNHSMRKKYRSAVYVFSNQQEKESQLYVENFQVEFNNKLITKVYPFKSFKASRKQITNYYYQNTERPFCKRFISPKFEMLQEKFSKEEKIEKLVT